VAATRALIRIALRHHWRTWLVLGILVGAASGAAMFLVAGARRTTSAISRHYEATAAEDAWVGGGIAIGGTVPDFARVERLPQVAAAGTVAIIAIGAGHTSAGKTIEVGGIAWYMPVDPRFGREVVRPQLLAGRLPDPTRADEAAVDSLALKAGLRLGESFTVRFLTEREFVAYLTGKLDLAKIDALKTGKGPLVTIHVVGVRELVQPDHLSSGQPLVFLTPAFTARYRRRVGTPLVVDFIRLRHGPADIAHFHREVQRIVGSKPVLFLKRSDIAGDVPRVATTQGGALLVLSIVTALAVLLLLGQIVTRAVDAQAPSDAPLRAMGLAPAQRLAVSVSAAFAIGLVAALTALAVSVAASPLMPIGPARDAEPDPGFDLNGPIVGSGVLAVVIAAVTIGAISGRLGARRAASARGGDLESSEWTALRERAIARSRLPVNAQLGMRMALARGRGRAAAPVRAGVLGLVVTIAGIVTVFGFRAGLTHLLDTPALYGERYSLVGTALPQDLKALARDRNAAGVALVAPGTAEIAGNETGVIALDPRQGPSPLVIAHGRAPAAADEVVLAAHTMHAAKAGIGSFVEIDAVGRHRDRVVGRAVLPTLVTPQGGVEPASGAAVTMAGMRRLGLSAKPTRTLVRLAPGVSPERELHRLGAADFATRQQPIDIGSLAKVERMPLAVILVLVVLGALALANAMVMSARRRRREFAVLKALGLLPRDAGSVIAWQALTMGFVAVALGVPLGIGLGRLAWNAFAQHQGMVPHAVTPWAAAAIVLPAALMAALLIGAIPAVMAARIRPAEELRSE